MQDDLAADLERVERLARGYRRVQDRLDARAVGEAARLDLTRKVVLVLALREFCPFARPMGERGRPFDPANWRTRPAPRVRIPAQRPPPMAETRRLPAPITKALLRAATPRIENGLGHKRLATELHIDPHTARRLIDHYRLYGPTT